MNNTFIHQSTKYIKIKIKIYIIIYNPIDVLYNYTFQTKPIDFYWIFI